MTVKEYNQSVDLYSDMVFRFLIKNTKDTHLSNDIIQDVFLKLWEKRKGVNFEKVKSYLFKMAYHKMIDNYRKNKHNEPIEDDYFKEENSYNELDTKDLIEKALNRLPSIQKAAITLRDYEGYSYGEIGEILNLNESQVKVYIYRGRKSLKTYFVSIENIL